LFPPTWKTGLRALEKDINIYVSYIKSSIPATYNKLEEIKKAQNEDIIVSQVIEYTQTKWPDNITEASDLHKYKQHASEFSMIDNILVKRTAVVIPQNMRQEMLIRLHTGHLGVTKCQKQAQTSVWWPGITKAIENFVKDCNICSKFANDKPEPLMTSNTPSRPWEVVGTDLCEGPKKTQYLVCVDYFSRYFEAQKLTSTTSAAIINSLKSVFARHGIPSIVRSDNGPQYASYDFKCFAQLYGFQHITSSPHYPQSNGEAERAVQTLKNILKKNEDPYLGLLAYRNSPLHNGYSPAELLMGRKLRSILPTLNQNLEPKAIDKTIFDNREISYKAKMQQTFNNRHKPQNKTDLKEEDKVIVKTNGKFEEGQVTQRVSNRSYNIEMPVGTIRRNRRHLVSITPQQNLQPDNNEDMAMNQQTDLPEAKESRGKNILRKQWLIRSFVNSSVLETV
jgi:hypothetical protein